MKFKFNTNSIKHFTIATFSTLLLSGTVTVQHANAANWLALQGTERAGAAPRARLWGFIQAQYQQDFSDPVKTATGDKYIPPKLIGPNLETQSQFNVNRARIGVRGIAMPLDSNVNYFFLAEFGRNAITDPHGGPAHITDSSVTLNHIKGAKIRVGLFKSPIAEEALQAIHVFDYINFTTVTNQLLLERFAAVGDTGSGATVIPIPVDKNLARYTTSVGAFRDVGVQLFDTFKSGNWEHSYAIKYGNGNGLNYGDNDNYKDLYLYIASERVFAGKGGRRQGMKFLAWSVSGKRTDFQADPTKTQERTRSGVGFKYLKKPFRTTVEYMQGEGMIFEGPHRPQLIFNDEKASGYYIDLGWYIPNSKFEIDFRYDSYTRGEKPGTTELETTFDTTTIGAQYHFNKKARLNMEYSMRDFKSDVPGLNTQNRDVGDRLALQITTIF